MVTVQPAPAQQVQAELLLIIYHYGLEFSIKCDYNLSDKTPVFTRAKERSGIPAFFRQFQQSYEYIKFNLIDRSL